MPNPTPTPNNRLTKAQRACPHLTRHPLIDPRFERCEECGLIVRAAIPAPWILAYDEEQPAPAAPELFPQRDPAAYIAESNATTSKRRPRRKGARATA